MAPMKVCNIALTTKEKSKLRKPAVEKMRRDRINGSIEQLKALLEKELKEAQPSSKLEKADILEMAVFYLRENLRPVSAPRQSYVEGFTKCLQETLRFLSVHDCLRDSQIKLLNHFHLAERRADKYIANPTPAFVPIQSCGPKRTGTGDQVLLWRPW